MTKHTIEFRDGTGYVGEHLLLIVYDAGDCDVVGPKTKVEKVVSALYDLHQCQPVFEHGDEIEFNGNVIAIVDGVHVVPAMRGG